GRVGHRRQGQQQYAAEDDFAHRILRGNCVTPADGVAGREFWSDQIGLIKPLGSDQPSSRQRRRRMATKIIAAPATTPIQSSGIARLDRVLLAERYSSRPCALSGPVIPLALPR